MADAWAVIAPDGTVAWYPLSATTMVEDLVAGEVARGALDRAFVTGPVRLMASDIALLFPDDYPANPLARRVLTALSGGRITQPWRGHVALVQYERDQDTGEWLWPGEMSPDWRAAIEAAVAAGKEADR